MNGTSIFSDFLTALGVKHTGAYSDDRFHEMPFRSLFGFSRLLTEYGVENDAYMLSAKESISDIPAPFIAQRSDGFVIVNSITPAQASGESMVDYTYFHSPASETLDGFISRMTGVVLLAHPAAGAKEPDYEKHHLQELVSDGKKWLLVGLIAFLAVFGIIFSGIPHHLSLILLLATDIAGLCVTFMLMQKTLSVSNHTADKVCGILQAHGCDTVLSQKASTFFGIVSWSEVGMAYFAMSTIILIIFPRCTHYLALINGCCLPFTLWSIWYQRFRIHTWCTLCVTTQALLWLQFFCFFIGDWWTHIFPLRIELFLMIAAYGALLLALNRLDNFIKGRSRMPLN